MTIPVCSMVADMTMMVEMVLTLEAAIAWKPAIRTKQPRRRISLLLASSFSYGILMAWARQMATEANMKRA